MNYPPPYMSLSVLAEHICTAESTIEAWVRKGIFPAPRKQGGRNLWRWKEVEKHLARGEGQSAGLETSMEAIRDATRQAASRDH